MKKIAFLSFVAALGGILFGYDTAVISGTFAAVGEQFKLGLSGSGMPSEAWLVRQAKLDWIIGMKGARITEQTESDQEGWTCGG